MPKIYAQKQGALNENDRLELARLLIKAGYTVRMGRERPKAKGNAYRYFVEYREETEVSE